LLAICGRIRCPTGEPFLDETRLDAFEESILGSRFDRHLGQATSSKGDGTFTISVGSTLGVDPQKVYLVVSDPRGRFDRVTAGEGEFLAETDPSHGKRWKGPRIDDAGKKEVGIEVSLARRPTPPPNDSYETVVVGSGFGGSIVALTLANKYAAGAPSQTNRVCVLERGQWWISGEVPTNAEGTIDGRPTIRQYLEENDLPFDTWAAPDDLSGFLRLIASSRPVDPVKGLYDYRTMRNVSTISASGVGGGSLIYFNLTARPDHSAYARWAIQSVDDDDDDDDLGLDRKFSFREVYGDDAAKAYFDDGSSSSSAEEKTLDYFDIAENFLGVNKITTTAPLGIYKLGKSRVFQQAATDIEHEAQDLMNPGGLDADLSITDVSYGTFDEGKPTKAERERLSRQVNACERQGRCGLGCIPDARHTMSQRLYEALRDGRPIDIFPLCRVDSVSESADDDDAPGFRYTIALTDFRDDPKGATRTIHANTVVLAAGSLGSAEVLLRSKNLRKSGAVGMSFSTNGDTFGIVSPTNVPVDASRGPLLTSIARYKDKATGSLEFSLEDLGVPKMFAEVLPPLLAVLVLERDTGSIVPRTNLLDLLQKHVGHKVVAGPSEKDDLVRARLGSGPGPARALTEAMAKLREGLEEARLEAEIVIKKLTSSVAPSSAAPLQDVMLLFGMGRDAADARLVIGGDGDGALTLGAPYDLDQAVYADMVDRMRLFAKEVGRDGEGSLVMPFWDERTKLGLTAHPLGGCPMARDASEGVVDGLGRVYSSDSGTSHHEGLYVVDGSIIPNSLGVNPSLTICALAFRIAEQIAGGKRYWPRG
jgi:cholesterol oxidase